MKIERDEGSAGTPRRRAEESSVFSLANLRAIAEADARRSTPARADAMPSFGGTELNGLGTVLPPPTMVLPVARPVLAPAPSNLPLVLTLGILLLTTIALAAYVVIDPRPQVVVTRVLAPEGEAMSNSSAAPRREAQAEVAAPTRDGTAHEAAAPKTADATSAEPPRAEVRSTRARRTVERRTVGERSATPAVPADTGKRRDVPLECVLDPNLPACGGKKSETPSTTPKQPADPALPETLGNTAIRNGIAAVKASAKSCGSKHGGTPGEKVRVKLSIEGATGAVSSTSAEDAHRGTALGNCVAAALKKASFPRFRKPVIGVEYTITL